MNVKRVFADSTKQTRLIRNTAMGNAHPADMMI